MVYFGIAAGAMVQATRENQERVHRRARGHRSQSPNAVSRGLLHQGRIQRRDRRLPRLAAAQGVARSRECQDPLPSQSAKFE